MEKRIIFLLLFMFIAWLVFSQKGRTLYYGAFEQGRQRETYQKFLEKMKTKKGLHPGAWEIFKKRKKEGAYNE